MANQPHIIAPLNNEKKHPALEGKRQDEVL
jgi:hypothetical protein